MKAEIQQHYELVWNMTCTACLFSKGPIHELPTNFCVLKFPPRKSRSMWTYATCNMSLPIDDTSIELHMHSPVESDEIVELLYVTAHFHINKTKLNWGHSVNFGRPWLVGATCSHGFISTPYLDGDSLETLTLGQREVKFYWLLPVTKTEAEFKQAYGVEALENQFEEKKLDYLDVLRRSVV